MMSSIHSHSGVQPPGNSLDSSSAFRRTGIQHSGGVVSVPALQRESLNHSFVRHCLWPCDDHRTVQGVHRTTTDGG